jgi:hypothetical protein
MTPEQITKWAREACIGLLVHHDGTQVTPQELQAFAAIIRQHTLEEAAVKCDGEADNWFASIAGQDACKDCAKEIRSLKT